MRRYIKSSYDYSCDWGDLTDAILDYSVDENEVKSVLEKQLKANGIKYKSVSLGEYAWSVDGLSFRDWDTLMDIGRNISNSVESEFGIDFGYEYSQDWSDTITEAILDYTVSEDDVKRALMNVLSRLRINYTSDCVSLGEYAWSVCGLSEDDYEKLQATGWGISVGVEKELRL